MATRTLRLKTDSTPENTYYIAIVSTANSYRMCWLLQHEGFFLKAAEPVVQGSPSDDEEASVYPAFVCRNENGLCWLLANKSPLGPLLTELPETDFILRVDGLSSPEDCASLVQRIRHLPSVTMAAEITGRKMLSRLKKL